MPEKSQLKLPDVQQDAGITTQEYVYLRLRNALMVGAIAPGSALTIRGLADYMGISPTPIREALRRLSSENAIEFLENRRIHIPQITLGRFEELILLRTTLEAHAAERALPYVSEILIGEMQAVDDQMDAAQNADAFDDLTILNQRFHQMLYTANPNQTVMPLIDSIWLQLGPFQRQIMQRIMGSFQIDRHKEILQALTSRDSQALRSATIADIQDGIGKSGREALS